MNETKNFNSILWKRMVNFHWNDNASKLRRRHRNNSQYRHSRPMHSDSTLVTCGLATCHDLLEIIITFHTWQATREKKKHVPSPQPKGIKTFLPMLSTNIYYQDMYSVHSDARIILEGYFRKNFTYKIINCRLHNIFSSTI